jgi:hypothetical protein
MENIGVATTAKASIIVFNRDIVYSTPIGVRNP